MYYSDIIFRTMSTGHEVSPEHVTERIHQQPVAEEVMPDNPLHPGYGEERVVVWVELFLIDLIKFFLYGFLFLKFRVP